MHIRCWDQLVKYGALDVLKREYGSLLKPSSEAEYNVSLEIDLEQIPSGAGVCLIVFPSYMLNSQSTEERDAFIMSVALFKRNALAAPFELAFNTQKQLEGSESGQGVLMEIQYRDEEAIYVQASADRVTVIFSTVFADETDRIFGKVFLQVHLTC
jgi:actin related protein 2/3 complex, subunit 2